MFSIFNSTVKIASKAANIYISAYLVHKEVVSLDTMGLLMWMIVNDVGELVLTWTKWGIGREQYLLIHLNSMERKNSTKDFPAFIENHKCEELN